MNHDLESRSERYLRDVIAVLERMAEDMPIKAAEISSLLATARRSKKRIYIMGNGGSSSTAAHMTSDLNKGANRDDTPRFRAMALSDNTPLLTAWANDSSYEDIFLEQLRDVLEPGDIVIGISGSGNSPNVLRAIDYANSVGATSIGLTGFDGGELAKIANISYVVPSECMQQIEDIHLIIEHMITMNLRDSPDC